MRYYLRQAPARPTVVAAWSDECGCWSDERVPPRPQDQLCPLPTLTHSPNLTHKVASWQLAVFVKYILKKCVHKL
jgi:hypothetical protein